VYAPLIFCHLPVHAGLVFAMAAFNKLGGLLRHSALVSGITGGSSPAVFNAARLMSTKLFIGGEFLLSCFLQYTSNLSFYAY
jgi:hypothetical protein